MPPHVRLALYHHTHLYYEQRAFWMTYNAPLTIENTTCGIKDGFTREGKDLEVELA